MFKKYFYLVRHGETILNAEKKRQGSEGQLSVLGREQVTEIANRLKKIKIEKMFVSPFDRTKESAEIINQILKIPANKIVFTELLAERKNPTCIIGKSYEDPIVKSFIDTADKSFHEANLRIYDEENFIDLRQRALMSQKYLIKNSETYNLCVTHGIFLKMFLATLIYGADLEVRDYIEMSEYNVANNAALTLVSFNSLQNFINKILQRKITSRENNPWEILVFNEQTTLNYLL